MRHRKLPIVLRPSAPNVGQNQMSTFSAPKIFWKEAPRFNLVVALAMQNYTLLISKGNHANSHIITTHVRLRIEFLAADNSFVLYVAMISFKGLVIFFVLNGSGLRRW